MASPASTSEARALHADRDAGHRHDHDHDGDHRHDSHGSRDQVTRPIASTTPPASMSELRQRRMAAFPPSSAHASAAVADVAAVLSSTSASPSHRTLEEQRQSDQSWIHGLGASASLVLGDDATPSDPAATAAGVADEDATISLLNDGHADADADGESGKRPQSSTTAATSGSGGSRSSTRPASTSTSRTPHPPSPADVFTCNICLDMAATPVVTRCGHLYCWPCLHEWLSRAAAPASMGFPLFMPAAPSAASNAPDAAPRPCPVCKAGVRAADVVPIYTPGMERADPRAAATPARPQAQRPPVPPGATGGFGGGTSAWSLSGGTWRLDGGIGAGATWGWRTGTAAATGFGTGPAVGGQVGGHLTQQQEFLARMFQMVGILLLLLHLFY
ncbi:hypothetical protein CXG81DRAFT_18060 [Caulochytrium protostelioides]|uniref:RING-type E3 ubiquitin transferase n=1 Tax=Caulochytrium protostelioides TaxID=1555241 RepID=A0A4P9XA87_9FUNG|nr:hypothetical protein CXG81DRAFT_18060 [Caulochytrium protostelioides]|eukprot:RKP02232.1 hypothetical protein CXG81DRAFT_18060 [Caulochytrium protostelioides]